MNVLGPKKVKSLKRKMLNYKERLVELSRRIIDRHDYSFRAISDGLNISNYQVSYALRNPDTTPTSKLINILTRLKKLDDPEFKNRDIKYVLHPTWVYPSNGEPFFVNGGTIASLYSVDLDECVLEEFATEEQKENCIALEVMSRDS